MSDAVGRSRPGPWVVGPFVVLGLLALVGLVANLVDWARGPETYEASRLIALDDEQLDAVESLADSQAFQLDLAHAASLPMSEIEVVACRPGEPSRLQVSVRHHDRRSAVRLATEIVPTLNGQIEDARAATTEATLEPVREVLASAARVVDPDVPPTCDLSLGVGAPG